MDEAEIGLLRPTGSASSRNKPSREFQHRVRYQPDKTPRLKVAFIFTLLPVLGWMAFFGYVMLRGETWRALLYPGVGLVAAGLLVPMIVLAMLGAILAVCVLTLRESHPAWGKVVLAALCTVPIIGCGLCLFLLLGPKGVTVGWIPFLTIPLCYFIAMLNLLFHAARGRAF